MEVRYYKTEIAVRPGDRVRFRNWFRVRDAVVVYVPGVSPRHRDFSEGPVPEIGLRSDKGYFYGVYVDPSTRFLRNTVTFVDRGSMEGISVPDALDDPVESNDGRT